MQTLNSRLILNAIYYSNSNSTVPTMNWELESISSSRTVAWDVTGFPVVLCLAVAAPAADEEEGGSGETCDCESPPARFFSSESWSRAHGSSRDPLRTCQQICIKIIRNCWAQQFAKMGGSGNPAALNLDPDPGFLPYLNPDPGLCFQVWIINIKKAKRKKISFKKIFKKTPKKSMAPEEIFSQLGLWMPLARH